MHVSRINQSVTWGFHRHAPSVAEFIKAVKEIGYKSIEMAPEEHWPAIKAAS